MESTKCRSMGVKDSTMRLFCALVRKKTKANKLPCVSTSKGGQGNAGSTRRGSCQLAGKGGNYRSKGLRKSRLLQPALPSEEGQRGLASNHRFVNSKQIDSHSEVQNGNFRVNKKDIDKRYVGQFHRSQRCVLPRPHTREIREISKVHEPRGCIPVQGFALRSKHRSPRIHASDERSENHSHEVWSKHKYVLGRLANNGSKSKSSQKGSTNNAGFMSKARPSCKSTEVRIDTHSELQVRGLSLHSESVNSTHTRGQNRQDSRSDRVISASTVPDCETVYAGTGSPGISRENHRPGPLPDAGIAVQFEPILEEGPESRETRACQSHIQTTIAVVDGRLGIKRAVSSSERAPSNSVHRQLSTGLGCTHRKDRGVRKVVPNGDLPAHKCPRDEGSNQSPKSLGTISNQQSGSGYVRQHNSGGVHKQARRYSLRKSMERSKSSASMVSCQKHSATSPSYKRLLEFKGGLSVKAWSDSQVRMVSKREYIPFSLPTDLISARSGFIRNASKPQAAKLRVTHAGLRGNGHRRHVPRLDRNVHIRLSTNPHITGSVGKDKGKKRVHGNSNSPGFRKGKLLSSAHGAQHRLSNMSKDTTSPKTTRHTDLPQKRGKVETARLDFVQRCIIKKGFSAHVAKRICSSVRKSTSGIYDRKWLIFSRWCHSRKISSTKAHVTQVADFLAHLQDEGKAPSTIEGYRTAIAETLKYSGRPDITEDPCIKALIKSHRLARVVAGNQVPPWDLAVVLKYISQAPFEPIHECEIKNLTLKTLFLVALASGKRRGELHALTREGFGWNHSKSVVTLGFDPTFVAKTQSKACEALKPLTLHSMNDFVGNDPDELILCPVRALLTYYNRVKSLGLTSKKKKKLFVSIQKGRTKDICSATIARWLKWLIIEAHKNILDKDLSLLGVKAHQIRGVSTSNAFKHASLDQVLSMGGWNNDSTFTNYYLKDLSLQNEHGYSLTPMMTGNIISKV